MQQLLHQSFAPSSEGGSCSLFASFLFANIAKYKKESEMSRQINDHPVKSRSKYPNNLSEINAGVIAMILKRYIVRNDKCV